MRFITAKFLKWHCNFELEVSNKLTIYDFFAYTDIDYSFVI